jgi:hypothetical protein
MEITKREWRGLGLRQTCERGIASGLTRLRRFRSIPARVLVGRYVLPALCAIAIGLGGCSATATAPGGPGAAAAESDTARPVCPATVYAGAAWYPNQEEAGAADCRQAIQLSPSQRAGMEENPPGSCLTDYFFSTKRPLCTAVDWLVVLPVAVLIVGLSGPAGY